MITDNKQTAPSKQHAKRRFRRFPARLPVTVLTPPMPPEWLSMYIQGETLELSRGGMSVAFPFDIQNLLVPTQSIRLFINNTHHELADRIIQARVIWCKERSVGVQFFKVVRTSDEHIEPTIHYEPGEGYTYSAGMHIW